MLPTSESSPVFSLSQNTASSLALIFDLDGTLVDSVPDLCAALNLTLSEDNRRHLSTHDVSQMVGNGVEVLIERAYTATGSTPSAADQHALVERFMQHYNKAPAALTRAFDGVHATLSLLAEAGHPMAVCTNKPQAPAVEILQALDLSAFFPVVLGAGAMPSLKPSPEPLHATLQALGHQGPAVMIGDSPNDSEAARAAGLPCVCVTFGYRRCSAQDLGANQLIEHFTGLPEALSHLFP
jgi:phosphoglycolate phosphatase